MGGAARTYVCSVQARRLHMDAHNVCLRSCQRNELPAATLHVLAVAARRTRALARARLALRSVENINDSDLETDLTKNKSHPFFLLISGARIYRTISY